MKQNRKKLIIAAVCLCLAGAVLFMAKPDVPADAPTSGAVMIGNPIRTCSIEEITALGYAFPTPQAAADVQYQIIDDGQDTPLAQAKFAWNDSEFCYRARETEEFTDISGMYYDWEETRIWSAGELAFELNAVESGEAWLGWYDAAKELQWCLSGQNGTAALFGCAQEIMDQLGYTVTVVPGAME